jgi:hypothetical protein
VFSDVEQRLALEIYTISGKRTSGFVRNRFCAKLTFVTKKDEQASGPMIGARVSETLRAAAHRKARSQGRTLTAVLKAFVIAWVNGDIPDPPFGLELEEGADE